jgi:F-type H+-transporting ATPase subunit gamma
MSDTVASLRRKIGTAADLQAVARTMKAIAASRISQYERSVRALADYHRTVELGLSACFREGVVAEATLEAEPSRRSDAIGAVVFGSDQGLVGRFNEVLAEYAIETLAALPGQPLIWAVGERVHARLTDAGLRPIGLFSVPTAVEAIAPLVAQIQIESETDRAQRPFACVYVFHNQPRFGSRYEPVSQRLLPLDATWQRGLAELGWPTKNLPEVMSVDGSTLRALIREHLFISLFRACAESLASENASRLAAMERAEKNIRELLEELQGEFNRLRQQTIDEELFDLIAGYESVREDAQPRRPGGTTSE